jgi:sterol desaturase/sphingolipid hydroxylase (fatty acid hydroxylase superfamily)
VDYWSHRLVHRIPLFWHIHKVHHAPADLTFATLFHHHFLMDIVAAPFMTVVTLFLGTHLVPPWGAFHLLVSFIQHANISPRFGWLNYIFAGPEIHRYHHSSRPEHYDTNFSGVLVYWDMVFGTFHYDPKEPATEFGLGDQVPEGFWRQQIDPLIWIAKDVARSLPFETLRAWGSTARDAAASSSAPSGVTPEGNG